MFPQQNCNSVLTVLPTKDGGCDGDSWSSTSLETSMRTMKTDEWVRVKKIDTENFSCECSHMFHDTVHVLMPDF